MQDWRDMQEKNAIDARERHEILERETRDVQHMQEGVQERRHARRAAYARQAQGRHGGHARGCARMRLGVSAREAGERHIKHLRGGTQAFLEALCHLRKTHMQKS
jgi:hypothetical protein